MKTVLVAVLDWGLGHATRCIPVIRELIKQNARVLVAGNGRSLALLKQEFPELPFYELPAYAVNYPEKGSMVLSIAKQIPRLLGVIKAERKSVTHIAEKENVDAIISDNRYGCYHQSVPSIMICHQLNLQLPSGWSWMKFLVDRWHNRYLKRFNEIWIPDMPDNGLSFSGDLSETHLANAKRIGLLSRFSSNAVPGNQYDVVAIISGPEPQRTIFENMVRSQLAKFTGKWLMVNGLPDGAEHADESVTEMNHLRASELNSILMGANLVIARSGYSTIMDLAALGKKAILIPTPGQTEQAYLAQHLSKHGWIVTYNQQNFDLQESLSAAEKTNPMPRVDPNALLLQTITDLLCRC